MSKKSESNSPIRSWFVLGTLGASAISLAVKAQKARNGTDRIAQAEVVVGLAGLLVGIAKALRDSRPPKPAPDTP